MAYCTIRKDGLGEYEEKKSRFLGEAHLVHSEEEIQAHLEHARKQYYDARHHCYAYILGEDRMNKRASDDGEPQGTAGQPILKVIAGAECTNVLVIVTRYFGGTLLGTGGLVRAYTAAAQDALQNAGIVTMSEGEVWMLSMEYPLYDKVKYFLDQEEIEIRETTWTASVDLEIVVPSWKTGVLTERLNALGNGKIETLVAEQGFFPFDVS